MSNSGVVEALTHGATTDNENKCIFKFSWGHRIVYNNNFESNGLSHAVVDTIECLFVNALARIADHKAGSNHANRSDTIKQAASTVGDASESLLVKLANAVFSELDRYTRLIRGFDPIDWKAFVKRRNKMRSDGQAIVQPDAIELDDEQTPDQIQQQRNAQNAAELETERLRQEQSTTNAQPRNRIDEILEDRADLEFKKIAKLYDDKTITKLLRMLDVFASVSVVNHSVAAYVDRVIRDDFVVLLLKMLIMCQFKHAIVICKVLHNISMLESGPDMLDSACIKLSKTEPNEPFKLRAVTQFTESAFLKFAFDLLLSIRSSQWSSQDFAGSGEYEVSS